MPGEMNTADTFYQGLVDIITGSYERSAVSIGTVDDDPVIGRLKSALAVWDREGHQWPRPAYEQGVPTAEYKGALQESIKETLAAFGGFLANSDIYSEEKNSANPGATTMYEDVMSVLDTPEQPTAITHDSDNSGLFYRDLVHNERYWEVPGSHIQLMRNLSDTMVKVTATCLGGSLEEKKG